MKVLFISHEKIKTLLDMPSVLNAVEAAFGSYARGKVQMPPKIYLDFKKYGGDLRIMPTYMEELGIAGTKIVNVHPQNQEKGLPTVMATIILNDPQTGALLAIMDGTYITNLRTGASGGIAAKYLARKNSKVIGLVGAGAQAETQLLALHSLFSARGGVMTDGQGSVFSGKIEKVKVVGLNYEKTKQFAKRISEEMKLSVEAVSSIKEAVDADIICTTTPSYQPIVMKEWIKPGTHINAIGADAPGKEELDSEILKTAKIVIDNFAQASHSGEINVPLAKGIISKENIYAGLGEIIIGKKAGRESDDEITIFDSTGLAIQDISCAKLAYDKAKNLKFGEFIEL
jgi:alanine dehydrogenase